MALAPEKCSFSPAAPRLAPLRCAPSRPAGYETTANALAFAVYLLACNPGGWLCSTASAAPVGGAGCGRWRSLQRTPRACRLRCLSAAPPLRNPTHKAGPEAKLLAEVGAWGRDRVPTAADVASFPYAAAVINEALRLYPPAGTIVREAPEGMELGGLRIPRDAALQVGGGCWGRAAGGLGAAP